MVKKRPAKFSDREVTDRRAANRGLSYISELGAFSRQDVLHEVRERFGPDEANKWGETDIQERIRKVDELYKHAPQQRIVLFQRVAMACLKELAKKVGDDMATVQFYESIGFTGFTSIEDCLLSLDEVDLQKVVRTLNESANGFFHIDLPPLKDRKRTEEKANSGKSLSGIRDIARMRVVTQEPESTQAIIESLSAGNKVYDDSGWELRQTGYLDRTLHMDVKGLACSLQFLDPGMEALVDDSHTVYECLRFVLDGNQNFDPSHMDHGSRFEMFYRYNELVKLARDQGYGRLDLKPDFEDFDTDSYGGESYLKERYYELHSLLQSIHGKAIKLSSPAWRALYTRLANFKNSECEDNHLLIPERYLESYEFITEHGTFANFTLNASGRAGRDGPNLLR